MPRGVTVSGLEADGRDRLFCGGAAAGKLRVVHKRGGGDLIRIAPRLRYNPQP